MKKRLLMVLALAVGFVMVMSSVAIAAPVGSKIISNELEGTFIIVEGLEKGISSVGFTMAEHGSVKGYILDIRLSNAKASDIESLTATIYKGDTALMTNTANMEKLKSDYPNTTSITSPFDVFGTFDYATDGYWNNSGWTEGISKLIKPDRAVVEVKFTDYSETTRFETTNLVVKHDIFPVVDVVAQDFGVMNISGVLGYTVGFGLVNATAIDVKSIEVSIYNGDTLLQTNTANMNAIKEDFSDYTSLSSPFDVFGTFSYQEDGYWTPGGWNEAVSELTVPDKAEIVVTFENDVIATAINETLSGEVSSIIPEQLITLTWNADAQFGKNESGAYIVNVDETNSFNITVEASSDYLIDNVLFIIEVDGGNFTAIADDGQNLGYDEVGDFWYWGPRSGFTFPRNTSNQTTFTVTAEPGTYAVKIYAVQLGAE